MSTSTTTRLIRQLWIIALLPTLICGAEATEPCRNEESKCTDKDPRLLQYQCMLWDKDWSLWCNQSTYSEIPDPKAAVSYASCENATALYIDDSCLKELKRKSLRKYPNLRTFLGGKNFIKELPDRVFAKNSNLERIDLCGNRIDSIDPTAFWGLSKLKELNLGSNSLIRVPGFTFRDLSSLTRLSFRDNNIAVLHSGLFGGLKKLKTLDLTDNRIVYINPRAFVGLATLENLYLDSNRLTTATAEIFPKSLQVLSLTHNMIEHWVLQHDSSLQSVRTLDLSFNSISKFDRKSVGNMTELESLLLESNSLSLLPEDTFSSTSKLRELNFANNFLKDIGISTFTHLSHLEILVLRSNMLTTPRSEWFARLVRNDFTNSSGISSNHWNCDCDALPYEKFLHDAEVRKSVEPISPQWINALQITCHLPNQLEGRILDKSTAKLIRDGDCSTRKDYSQPFPSLSEANYKRTLNQDPSVSKINFPEVEANTESSQTRKNIANATLAPHHAGLQVNRDLVIAVSISLSAFIVVIAGAVFFSWRFYAFKKEISPDKNAENTFATDSDRHSTVNSRFDHAGQEQSQKNLVFCIDEDKRGREKSEGDGCYINEAMVAV